VTLTIGGNDVGFGDLLRACLVTINKKDDAVYNLDSYWAAHVGGNSSGALHQTPVTCQRLHIYRIDLEGKVAELQTSPRGLWTAAATVQADGSGRVVVTHNEVQNCATERSNDDICSSVAVDIYRGQTLEQSDTFGGGAGNSLQVMETPVASDGELAAVFLRDSYFCGSNCITRERTRRVRSLTFENLTRQGWHDPA
jgi:hypothetical protein